MQKWRQLVQKWHSWQQESWWRVGAVLLMIASAVVLVFLVQMGRAQSGQLTLQWMQQQPMSCFIGVMLCLSMIGALWAASNRGWIAVGITGLILLALASANYFKIIYRYDPLIPADLRLWQETIAIMHGYNLIWPMQLMKAWAAWLILTIVVWLLVPKMLDRNWRISIGVSVLIVLIGGWWLTKDSSWMMRAGIDYDWRGDQVQETDKLGLLTYFVMRFQSSQIHMPLGYGERAMAELQQEQKLDSEEIILPEWCAEGVKPNVIAILSESWVDVESYPRVQYKQKITPNYDELSSEFDHGHILVNTRGGGTAETELEILTGMASSLNPQGSVAFNAYLHRPVPSLASTLAQAGYKTWATHPNIGEFFRRQYVYPKIGFERFDDIDTYDDLPIRGDVKPEGEDWEPVAFVADTAVLDKIKQMLAEPSEQPKFIWAVTIENHGDYIYKRFTEEEYQEVEGVFVPATKGQEEDWTAFQQQMWKNYLIGVHDADKMLGELVKLVQESEQPTIILFFGDHWPSFVEDVEWKILGEQENAVWTTPFLIYDNFTTVQQRGQDYGLMSAFHLGPILLEHACVQPTGLQAWLDKQRNEGILGYNLQVMVTPEGKMVPLLQMDEKTEEVRGQHWMWQYDWLFGKQYSLGENVN